MGAVNINIENKTKNSWNNKRQWHISVSHEVVLMVIWHHVDIFRTMLESCRYIFSNSLSQWIFYAGLTPELGVLINLAEFLDLTTKPNF